MNLLVTPEEMATMTLEELEAKAAELEALMAKAESVNPLVSYVPNPPQYQIIKRLAESVTYADKKTADGYPVVTPSIINAGSFWANGVGKSWGLVIFTGNVVFGPQCKWFDYRLFKEWPFSKHLRWVVDSTELKETGELWRAVQRWWPKHLFDYAKDGYDYFATFKFKDEEGNPNGFTLSIRTHDQPVKLHESDDVGFVGFNEPPQKIVWDAYPARFRHGGIRWICGTLVSESAWITDMLIENSNAICEFADAEANCAEHARLQTPFGECRGHLTHDSIQQRIAEYDEFEREARATGKPIHLRGRVFAINPSVHFIPRSKIPRELTYYLALDPHLRRPWAMVVGGIDDVGRWFIVDEWPGVGDAGGRRYDRIVRWEWGLKQYVDLIQSRQSKWNIEASIIDGRFSRTPGVRDYTSGNLRLDLEANGLYFYDGDTRVEGEGGGMVRLNQLLRYDNRRPVDTLNQPMLYVADDLVNVKYQLMNVCWDEYAAPDKFGRKEKLRDDLLDFPRCLMYLIMHQGGYSPVAAENPICSRRLAFLEKLSEDTGRDFVTNARLDYDGESEQTGSG